MGKRSGARSGAGYNSPLPPRKRLSSRCKTRFGEGQSAQKGIQNRGEKRRPKPAAQKAWRERGGGHPSEPTRSLEMPCNGLEKSRLGDANAVENGLV